MAILVCIIIYIQRFLRIKNIHVFWGNFACGAVQLALPLRTAERSKGIETDYCNTCGCPDMRLHINAGVMVSLHDYCIVWPSGELSLPTLMTLIA